MENDFVTVIFSGALVAGGRTFAGDFDYRRDQAPVFTTANSETYEVVGRFTLEERTASNVTYTVTIRDDVILVDEVTREVIGTVDELRLEADVAFPDGSDIDLRVELASFDLALFEPGGPPDSLALSAFDARNVAIVAEPPVSIRSDLSALGSRDGRVGDVRRLEADEARTVARLYEAAFDRDGDIDLPGLNFWIDSREGGLTEEELSQAFLDSPEFEDAFGDPALLTDVEFVRVLYRNILDREGEQGGVEFWTGALRDRNFDRDDLLLVFAQSPENVAGTAFVNSLFEVEPGFWDFVDDPLTAL